MGGGRGWGRDAEGGGEEGEEVEEEGGGEEGELHRRALWGDWRAWWPSVEVGRDSIGDDDRWMGIDKEGQ